MNKIKFIALLLVLVIALTLVLSGCNAQFVDTVWSYKEAYIRLYDGKYVHGNVVSWKDWEDSDVIQVTLDNGNTYYSHASNIVLIA